MPTWLGYLLMPWGLLYGGLMHLRRWLYQNQLRPSYQLPGIVLSIGNLEAGGTGKSPVVMAIATLLLSQGAKPAILTRGYRSGLSPEESAVYRGSHLLLAPQSGRKFQADEGRMQAENLGEVPVIIGSDRKAAALRYLQKFSPPTHWLLDDGFQHLRLQRQLDIVLLDALRPFADGRCIPAGRLREFPGTLRRAQYILLTRALDNTIPAALLADVGAPAGCIQAVYFRNGEPRQVHGKPIPWRQNKTWLLALGIAQPQRIIQYCVEQKIPITEQLLARDHEEFSPEILAKTSQKVEALLTTEKDYWRQPDTFQQLNQTVYVLPLELKFADPNFLPAILAKFTHS